jgi:hypothetical protein
MTIEFNCPNCNAVIGFADEHTGKQAHCTACGQKFIIPGKSFEKAKKIKPPQKKEKAEPIPGFYRAVLVENWKIFFNLKNVTPLAFILTVVVFKFFTACLNFDFTIAGDQMAFDFYIPLGWICTAMAWGILFWYYREMIYSTGFDQDDFPEVIVGGLYSIIWKIVQSVYILFIIFLVIGCPAIIAYFILKSIELESPLLLYSLISIGVFLLPAAITNISMGRDITLLRPDYFLKMIFRAFVPYFVVSILLGAAIALQVFSRQYNPKEPSGTCWYLLLNFATQMVFVFAMRAIGLYYRHYSCHAPW